MPNGSVKRRLNTLQNLETMCSVYPSCWRIVPAVSSFSPRGPHMAVYLFERRARARESVAVGASVVIGKLQNCSIPSRIEHLHMKQKLGGGLEAKLSGGVGAKIIVTRTLLGHRRRRRVCHQTAGSSAWQLSPGQPIPVLRPTCTDPTEKKKRAAQHTSTPVR